jgi:photosystem II stability/assembly factor-like uncharacterized protein
MARILLSVLLTVSVFTFPMLAQFNPELFGGMQARSIGPAGMSGRIASIDVVASNPDVIYVGAATGGVWKSVNGGTTWFPLFDDQPVAAIGAVSVCQSNPSIVWVGTGEGNPRNSASVGNGIFKSVDGGRTWKQMGLEGTERIHRVLVDPANPQIVYAAAMGRMWGENSERGVYKTTDGGSTWNNVLFVNNRTGCADLVMDPSNPNKLIAAMWEYRRWPWFFNSGGVGSGLYITYDGGEHWSKVTPDDGIPKGELGRIGIAIARNNPDVVYALIEATKNVLCRSDDGGKTWRVVNRSPNVAPRPFYYADIYLDPDNENRLYSLHSNLQVSDDGGKSFSSLGRGSRVHSDHHALWIHPQDGSFLIDGNDGGVAISRDRGKTWRIVDNLPLAQFYHINVDLETPYNVYGGMQDNGSWRGPSEVWENWGIRNWHWTEVGYGDGFATLVDASYPDHGYAMSQGGELIRFNWKTGERKSIRPWGPDDVDLRFNWNAGIAQDPFDPKTVYYGSQFVHKSTDRGENWSIISGDLTTNDTTKQRQAESGGLTKDVTNAENYTSIITIAPSPVQQGVLWVGTDDGMVQVTRDGGGTWVNVSENIPGVENYAWVAHIEASKFRAGEAYVVFDDHRRSDWTTYLFKTEDFGRSWRSLTENDPTQATEDENDLWGYALALEQDPLKEGLLYLGTEFGLWISFDDGGSWMKWTHGFPTVSAMALIVHPRDHDLVIGTHGRAAYILDDVRPLRSATREVLASTLHVFDVPATYQHRVKQTSGYHFPGDAMFRGQNKSYGAMITYNVNLPAEEKVRGGDATAGKEQTPAPSARGEKKDTAFVDIEILDDEGSVIRTFRGPAKRGINRGIWDLRMDGWKSPRLRPREVETYRPRGPEVLPGTYTIRLKAGGREVTTTVEVKADPRVSFSMQARLQNFDMLKSVGQRLEVATEAVDRIQQVRKAIQLVMDQTKGAKDSVSKDLRESSEALKKKIKIVADQFIFDSEEVQGIARNPNNVATKLRRVLGSVGSSWDEPNSTQERSFRQAEQFLVQALAEFNEVFSTDVPAYRAVVGAEKLRLFPEQTTLSIDWVKAKENDHQNP